MVRIGTGNAIGDDRAVCRAGSRPAFDFPGASFAFGSRQLRLIYDPDVLQARWRHYHCALLVDDTFEAKPEIASNGVTEFNGHAQRPMARVR
jgi:hypothetical protein